MQLYNVDIQDMSDSPGTGHEEEVHVPTIAVNGLVCHIETVPFLQHSGFYCLFPDGQFGSVSYMAKAVVNKLLHEGLSYDTSQQCCIS